MLQISRGRLKNLIDREFQDPGTIIHMKKDSDLKLKMNTITNGGILTCEFRNTETLKNSRN